MFNLKECYIVSYVRIPIATLVCQDASSRLKAHGPWGEAGFFAMFVLTPNKGSAKLRLRKAAQKYTEAVTVAAEKCAGDTKGQTCYICTEAVH